MYAFGSSGVVDGMGSGVVNGHVSLLSMLESEVETLTILLGEGSWEWEC